MRAVLATSCAFAAYLLFAGTLSMSETITGGVLGGLGAASLAVFGRVSERRFRFAPDHIQPWGRALRRVPAAVLRTGMALARALPGGGRDPGHPDERPFRHGARDAPAERARRASAVLAASLAPNSFVVRAEPGRETVLVHAIDHRPEPADPEWLA